MTLGAALLFAIGWWRSDAMRAAPGESFHLVIAGLLNMAGFNVMVAFAQLAGTTTRATIVTYTMPMWALLFAWLLLRESPDRRRWLAIALGAAGITVLALPLLMAGNPGRGVWFALAGGMSWGAGTVYIKRFVRHTPSMASLAWQLVVGAMAAGLGMLIFEGVPVPKALSLQVWLALAYHVLCAMVLAYLLWFAVVAHLDAGAAALTTLIVPVIGVSGAMFVLGERPSLTDLAGFVLILVSATLAVLPRRT